MDVLLLCTANVCRSVMAAALLRRRLHALGVTAGVDSAGFLRSGNPPPAEVISVMAHRGMDVASHRSRVVRGSELAEVSLVIGMTRAHVRFAVTSAPEIWHRCFTLKEFVRRGEMAGHKADDEPMDVWLMRLQMGRSRSALLGESQDDDVPDPIGGHMAMYTETATMLDDLITRMTRLCWDSPGHL